MKLGSVIGSGGFGKVHRAVINPAGRASYEAAVKIPHHQGDNDLKQEALIFNLLQHTNILRFVLYFKESCRRSQISPQLGELPLNFKA